MKKIIRNTLFYIFVIGFMIIAVIHNINKPIVLILHSYKDDYSWTRNVNDGLQKVLNLSSAYTLRWHYMDTKNHPSEAHKIRASILARRVIDEINPDIIVAIDDDAQEYVAKHYINAPNISIVFCGVNSTLETYGYDDAENVTGILERIPLQGLRDSLRVIKTRNPQIQDIRILHLSDDSGTVQEDDLFIHNFGPEWEEIQVAPSVLVHTYRDWKKAVNLAPNEANFLIVSNYRKVYDDAGNLVPPEEVLQWTVANSKIPVIGVNGFVVEDGAHFAVATSPFEQGEVAATIVHKILHNKIPPKDIPITQTKQFIIYIRGKFDLELPSIYEAFARAANTYWEQ